MRTAQRNTKPARAAAASAVPRIRSVLGGVLSGSLPHCPAGNLEDYLFYFLPSLVSCGGRLKRARAMSKQIRVHMYICI